MRKKIVRLVAVIAIAAGAVLGVTAVTASAASAQTQGQAGHAAVDTGSACTTGSSSGNVTTCLYATTVNADASTLRVTSCVHRSGRTLEQAIYRPNGSARLVNTPGYVGPGRCVTTSAAGVATFTGDSSGIYCGVTYRANGGGGGPLVQIGRVCLYVSL